MAPVELNVDFYAVLEISHLATVEVATKSYRRLAKIRHPDKNLNGDSTALFQLLQNAYDTISDPVKRQAYDLRWSGIRDTLRAEQNSAKWAAEAKAKAQKDSITRQERLRDLALAKSRLETDIFDISRAVRKLKADLKRLQEQDDEDVRKEKERNSWWTYLTHGKVSETDEQRQERETAHFHRLASKSIKGAELGEKEAKLQGLQDALQNTDGRIAAEKQKAEQEKRRAEEEARARNARMEQETRDRAMREMRENMARERREKAERFAAERAAAEKAREAREAQMAREAQERARTAAAAAETRRKEAQERVRAAEEAARKAKKTDRSEAATTTKTCRHDRFWPQIEGRQSCGKCRAVQTRFAFQCPGCGIVACANCRQSLREKGRQKGKFSGRGRRRDGFADAFSSHDYDYD